MIKERAWPARAMYILIAAALAMSLIIMAAPAQKLSAAPDEVLAEWDMVSTPTLDGFLLAPDSTIIDYALDSTGKIAYAVVEGWRTREAGNYTSYWWLVKSDDNAATWGDLNEELEKVDKANNITSLVQVATDWVDPEFVAVALVEKGELRVYFSTDGGEEFEDAKEVEDVVYFSNPNDVSDLAVSIENADGDREIAIGGTNGTAAALFRCKVEGDNPKDWEDATDYDGWDDEGETSEFTSELVTDIIFSPNWDKDKTILVTTVDVDGTGDVEEGTVHLQSGSWVTSPGWNLKSSLGIEAVPIVEGKDLPIWLADLDARAIAGMTLPEDYNSKNTDDRVLWVWVNYYDDSTDLPTNEILRVDDDDAGTAGPMSQVEDGEVWLTNISYKGTIAEGEAIAGVLGDGVGGYTACCDGVDVYHNGGIKNMIVCCEPWKSACKPPTGRAGMAVSYVGEAKAYAVALHGDVDDPYDESAWSVTFDDGDTWNQVSLVDTKIDYLSDVAVSPDCNKTMLVSVHKVEISYCDCDSVWLHAVEFPEAGYGDDDYGYNGHWLRTWCDELEGCNTDYIKFGECVEEEELDFPERGFLRLAPEELKGADVLHVFLVDRMSGNVYMNDLETLGCWDPIASTTVNEIVDLAARDAETLFALDMSGDVSMFDAVDEEWHEEVLSEVGNGWTIAVHDNHILVGGQDGDVSYTDDFEAEEEEIFTEMEDVETSGYVTVAFDTYFDTNNVIYAALAGAGGDNGIYRWVMDESTAWKDLQAEPYDYTGLVVDRPGNPYTSPETGGVIYASYVGNWTADIGDGCDTPETWCTGVARRLYPAEEVICAECGEWDYLTVGLNEDNAELFVMTPDALKICGCLDPTTNSKLFAIDGRVPNGYDMDDGEDGTVWTFEDCYGKKAPTLKSPADGEVIDADPCSCYSVPFTFLWDRLCDACSYDIQIALDEEFDEIVYDSTFDLDLGGKSYRPPAGNAPSYHIQGGLAGGLSCESTYYWKVRAADAENCQIIHSWWSEARSLTIAPQVQSGIITLVAPEPGALNQPTKNLGFSWNLLADADAFDWVLSANADLSSPLDSNTGLTSTATSYTGTLTHGTTYYWQVTAYNEGAPISMSAIGTFTTGATGPFCSAIDGMCFETREELEAHNAGLAEEPTPTPFWVWVVIAIGAVLVIVVIVLIFRTRRV